MPKTIHPDTLIGAVYLVISDLERSIAFYQDVIGLSVIDKRSGSAHLGAGDNVFLILEEKPGAKRYQRTSGLYHFAILVPSRLDLAKVLYRFLDKGIPLQGFADHLVSEAIYLADPDGNGIEIYRDRPRSDWPKINGRLQMATDPLDVEGILAELNGETQIEKHIDPKTTIGHIHLHVSNLREAEYFYAEILGFDLILRLEPSASFLSAGGYHHHIGINTWAGVGVPPPPADAIGLDQFEIILPTKEEVDRVANKIKGTTINVKAEDDGFSLKDPAGNRIYLKVKIS